MSLGSRLKDVIGQAARNFVETKGGLLVPPTVVAGKHFGGFQGYEHWVQECIATACRHARPAGGSAWTGIEADELGEITAACMWEPPERSDEPAKVHVALGKHDEVMTLLERYAESIPGTEGLESGFLAQVTRAHGIRERGTLLVVALKVAFEEKGEITASVSAWNPASVEEALAVPAQKYGRTYG
jgi:hypothetical protein